MRSVVFGIGSNLGDSASILQGAVADLEVFRQPLTSKGIRVGDDVWIGSHVVILDGVTVGSRSVLAAGAIVTKDVAEGAIVGGNPAKFIRWRVPPVDELDLVVLDQAEGRPACQLDAAPFHRAGHLRSGAARRPRRPGSASARTAGSGCSPRRRAR